MITNLYITQSNTTEDSNLVAIHSPLVFIVDATYTGAPPDIGEVRVSIYDGWDYDNLLDAFICNVLEDPYPGVRRFYFRADSVLRGWMDGFDDNFQSDGSFLFVDEITKQFRIVFSADGISPLPFVDIDACHAARQYGESATMIDIATNEQNVYTGVQGVPVDVYFYNDDASLVVSIGDTSFEEVIALDYDDEEFEDFDGVPFTIEVMN